MMHNLYRNRYRWKSSQRSQETENVKDDTKPACELESRQPKCSAKIRLRSWNVASLPTKQERFNKSLYAEDELEILGRDA